MKTLSIDLSYIKHLKSPEFCEQQVGGEVPVGQCVYFQVGFHQHVWIYISVSSRKASVFLQDASLLVMPPPARQGVQQHHSASAPRDTQSAGKLSSLIQMEKSDDNLFLSQS